MLKDATAKQDYCKAGMKILAGRQLKMHEMPLEGLLS